MPTVQVEGLGRVQFPEGTSEADMTKSIQDALMEKNAPAPLSGPIGGAQPDPITSNHELLNQANLWEGFKGAGKGVLGTIGDTGALVNKLPVVGEAIAPKSEVNYFQQHSHAENPEQMAGKIAEGVGELALPALKGVEALPSAERAGATLGRVAEAAKDVKVPLSKSLEPLQRVTELGARGGTSPKAAGDLLTRSQALEPMSFPEARDYYSNISSLSADEANKLNAKMKSAVGALRKGFHGDLTDAAEQVGMGQDYANALKEYAQAMRLRGFGENLLTKALPAGGVLGAIGYGLNKLRGH